MNIKRYMTEKFILIALGISFSVLTHAETRPSLSGLQTQINDVQAQIKGSCGCWTQQELLDIVTKQVDWFSYYTDDGAVTYKKQSPFECTRNYEFVPPGDTRTLEAKIAWPGGGGFGTTGSVSASGVSEGGPILCKKDVNGVVTEVNLPSAQELQQCYAQIISVGQTLPGCNFTPITVP